MEETGGICPPVKQRDTSMERKRRAGKSTLVDPTAKKVADSSSKSIIISHLDSDKSDKIKDTDMTDGTTAGRRANCKYDGEHKGPYMVYVDSYDSEGIRKFLSGISLSRILTKLNVKGVSEVIKIGYGRCKVVFKDWQSANVFAADRRLDEHQLTPKIFEHFVSKIAIVFDIPLDISEDEFKDGIISPIPVVRCIRMTRRVRDEDGEMKSVPHRNMKIVFKGTEIPNEIVYGYVKIPVKHFISFAQCYRCYRFNHFAQHCKQTFELCKSCYNQHGAGNCGDVKCTNCGGDHSPTFKECPARLKAFALRKLMTIENLSTKEARLRVRGVFSNSFEALSDDDREYPLLPKTKTPSKIVDNHRAANEVMYGVASYAKVAKSNMNREREVQKAQQTWKEHQKIIRDFDTSPRHDKLAFPEESFGSKSGVGDRGMPRPHRGTDNTRFIHDQLIKLSADISNLISKMNDKNTSKLETSTLVNTLRDNVNISLGVMDLGMINGSWSTDSPK